MLNITTVDYCSPLTLNAYNYGNSNLLNLVVFWQVIQSKMVAIPINARHQNGSSERMVKNKFSLI